MFWDQFIKLCTELNTKPNPVAKELGISSGILTKWKNGSLPSTDALLKISEYFNVSIDYLLGRTEQKNTSMNNGSVINSGSNNNIQNGNNIINSNNNNIAQSDNNQKSLDETSVQVAEMFQNLDIQNKAKVLSYMIEVTK
ncbi:MAG: helix-turn-helix transcriptional regulator [Oscillospiraceae bacterium]|nr:helix-turn-helix transcriptional regulator [Oscillospiraceae bacterium]